MLLQLLLHPLLLLLLHQSLLLLPLRSLSPDLCQVAYLDRIHLATPREEDVINELSTLLRAFTMHFLVSWVDETRIQAALQHRVGLHALQLVFPGFQILHHLSQFVGERTNAAMPFLLSILHSEFFFIIFFTFTIFVVVIIDSSHIWKSNCIGVQEDTIAPPSVLDHLLGFLVVELRDNG